MRHRTERERRILTEMVTENKSRSGLHILIPVIVPSLVTAVCAYFVQSSAIAALRAVVSICIISFGVISLSRKHITLRVSMFMTLLALVSAVQGFIPDFMVPIAAFSVVIAFISSPTLGLTTVLYFTAIPFLITERSFEYFLFVTVIGVIGMALMYSRSRSGKYAEVLVTFSLLYVLLYTALIVMKRMDITPEVVIDPVVGLILSVIIMEISGYRYYNNVIKKSEDLYKTVVDPEHPLLLELKSADKTEYKRAIHTAHYTDLFAEKFGYDKVLMRGLGFYHRIGVLIDDDATLAMRTMKLATSEGFPSDLMALLKEYGEIKEGSKVSAEVSIAFIVDNVICDLMNEFAKGKGDPDMNKFIDSSILRLFSGKKAILKKSAIPYYELEEIRRYLKGEKMYYDFLR